MMHENPERQFCRVCGYPTADGHWHPNHPGFEPQQESCENCGLVHGDVDECGPADENGPAWYR